MSQQPDATPKVIAGSDQAADEAAPAPSRQRNSPARAAGQDKEPRKEPDLSARAAELEAELADVRARAAGEDTVRLRVDPDSPHSGMVFNGIVVSEEWTEVPSHIVPDMMEGAANAGVVLTQDETES